MQIVITLPTVAQLCRSWRWLLLTLFVLMLTLGGGATDVTANESITTPDTAGDVGQYTSLALDAAGNPVVGYRDVTNNTLTVMHCNDVNCAGGGDSFTSPDTAAFWTSLALDASGNPVVSYLDTVGNDLAILHCDDANCAAGGESITFPDTAGIVGHATSLELDAAGNPVVSYWDVTNNDLKVTHCNDPDCAGGDESVTSPDTAGNVGSSTSLELDAAGNPVISYYDATNNDLRVLHCNDANCAPGGDSFTSPDTAGTVGPFPSLVLDAAGHPVISYDGAGGVLSVLHCNDANCAPGGDSITTPDTFGSRSSLVLDATGNPVVGYLGTSDGGLTTDLKVLHCNDANCAGGDESGVSVDSDGNVGFYPSLALDAVGNPVVSYYDSTDDDLKVLHCDDANCATAKQGPINITSVGQYALPKTCFEVRDAAQTPLFEVCDNDFEGPPASHAVCLPDGVCDDEDPAPGAVSVTVLSADYRLVESTVPFNHTAPGKQVCDATSGSCSATFTNTPLMDPWYPWDIDGNGVVDLFNDIFGVADHFGCGKGATGEDCP